MNSHQVARIEVIELVPNRNVGRANAGPTSDRQCQRRANQHRPTDTQRNNDAMITSPLRQNDVGDVALTQRRRHHCAVCPPGAVHVAISGARPRGPVPLTMFNRTRNPTKIEMLAINTNETTYWNLNSTDERNSPQSPHSKHTSMGQCKKDATPVR